MRMKAIPVSAGSALSSWLNASSPPAEAPTPTMGKDGRLEGAAGWGGDGRRAFFECRVCRDFVPFRPMAPLRRRAPSRAPAIPRLAESPGNAGPPPPPGDDLLAVSHFAGDAPYPCCLVCAEAVAFVNVEARLGNPNTADFHENYPLPRKASRRSTVLFRT